MARPAGQVIVRMDPGEIANVSGRAMGRAMNQVAEEIELYIQEHSSTLYPPPSKPGQYPHERSGDFKSGVHVTGTQRGFTVYSRAPYGIYLEEGNTRGMAPRPWAYRALVARDWLAKVAKLAREFTGGSRRRSR